MIQGHVRDDFPYVMVSLPGQEEILTVEFIVDTGFSGELALPGTILHQLEAAFAFEEDVILADGSRSKRPYYELLLDWNGESRLTEVLLLAGAPLLGNGLLSGHLLQSEMIDGGEVLIEPL